MFFVCFSLREKIWAAQKRMSASPSEGGIAWRNSRKKCRIPVSSTEIIPVGFIGAPLGFQSGISWHFRLKPTLNKKSCFDISWHHFGLGFCLFDLKHYKSTKWIHNSSDRIEITRTSFRKKITPLPIRSPLDTHNSLIQDVRNFFGAGFELQRRRNILPFQSCTSIST